MSTIQSAIVTDPRVPIQTNSPAVQTTAVATSLKPKKISSRPKFTDNALQEDYAAPDANQKRVCALKLTYHRGAEPNDANSLTPHTTELLGYKPTTNAYEKKSGGIKADGSKFAMPNLDKPLCQSVVYTIGVSDQLPKARILLYILKFKNELPKSANKYMYKALLVSDPEGGHFVHRVGHQETTITTAASSLLISGETIDGNSTSQQNDTFAIGNPIWNPNLALPIEEMAVLPPATGNAFIGQYELDDFYKSTSQRDEALTMADSMEAEALPNVDVVMDQTWDPNSALPLELGDFYDSTSRRNDALIVTNPIEAAAYPTADIMADQSCDTNFAMPTEEEWAALPTLGNGDIEVGDLYEITSPRIDASAVTNPVEAAALSTTDGMANQDWMESLALPAEDAAVWPIAPENGYINPSDLGNLDDSARQLDHASINGPNYFDEALAESGDFPMGYSFNDTAMPDVFDQDVDMQDTMPTLDDYLAEYPFTFPDQDMQDPMPALGEDIVTPPTPALTTPLEPSVEPQGLCSWEDLIPPMVHAAPYMFDDLFEDTVGQ